MKKEELRMNNKDKQSVSDQIEGRNSVLELLESDRDINKIFIAKGERHGSINKIIAKAKERKIVIVEVEKQKLNAISETENHQGVIAIVPPFNYCEVEDILEEAKSKNEDPFILILDGIEDPHNLGSIIRTAETAGGMAETATGTNVSVKNEEEKICIVQNAGKNWQTTQGSAPIAVQKCNRKNILEIAKVLMADMRRRRGMYRNCLGSKGAANGSWHCFSLEKYFY